MRTDAGLERGGAGSVEFHQAVQIHSRNKTSLWKEQTSETGPFGVDG